MTQYDYDWESSVNVFAFQLENIAKFLESKKAFSARAKEDAMRIRTVLKLMKKVYDEEYLEEYHDKLAEIYDKEAFEFVTVPVKFDGELKKYTTHRLCLKYEIDDKYKDMRDEMKATHSKLFQESIDKQNKAHRILWEMIEHRIQWWWD